jgi:hypothetical protein
MGLKVAGLNLQSLLDRLGIFNTDTGTRFSDQFDFLSVVVPTVNIDPAAPPGNIFGPIGFPTTNPTNAIPLGVLSWNTTAPAANTALAGPFNLPDDKRLYDMLVYIGAGEANRYSLGFPGFNFAIFVPNGVIIGPYRSRNGAGGTTIQVANVDAGSAGVKYAGFLMMAGPF